MITPTDNHQKHAKLARPSLGEWGRNELAILGTTCDDIRQLAELIIASFPQYKFAYIDADHKSDKADAQQSSMAEKGAFIEHINKISYAQYNTLQQPDAFQKKLLFQECDWVLVNGNHASATRQIVVIDERKPLDKKLDRLTDVKMIILKDRSAQIPDFLSAHFQKSSMPEAFFWDDKNAIINHLQTYFAQQIPVLHGLVLSGGQSTRMGRDKGALTYHNKTQREYVFDMLSPLCRQTFVSCNHEQAQTLSGTFPIVEDSFLGLGPVGGILSAFQHNPNVAWLTVACDLPLLTPEVLQHLVSHRDPSKIATAFLDSDGRFPEPLITIWEPKAYPVLLQFLSLGYSCPRKALINSDSYIIQSPDASAFKNVNTAEDYEKVVEDINNKHSS